MRQEVQACKPGGAIGGEPGRLRDSPGQALGAAPVPGGAGAGGRSACPGGRGLPCGFLKRVFSQDSAKRCAVVALPIIVRISQRDDNVLS